MMTMIVKSDSNDLVDVSYSNDDNDDGDDHDYSCN
jgi:hypothetical protein